MRFENLEIWKISSELSAKVYQELRDLRDYGFKDQITRSCLSIPSNIAEGVERQSEKEKFQFLSIAKGSAAEFKTQTYIGIKIGYISEDAGQTWLTETERIAAMLSKLMLKIKASIEL